jgi:predicted glycosyltransferase
VTRPRLLFYCQHSVGMGHLVRSLTLAEALSDRFDVVLLSGGVVPPDVVVPPAVRVVPLPPLGHDGGYELVSRDPHRRVEEVKRARAQRILGELRAVRPEVVIVELYPFGRRKFAFELLPLLEASRTLSPRPVVLSSVRDILVASRRDQARHDEQASAVANRWFDSVLVHADPRFARLEESFSPRTPLTVPVHYTGFVDRPRAGGAVGPISVAAGGRICVSAGGGLVGGPLFRAAAQGAPVLFGELGLPTTIVAGPLLPATERADLERVASEGVGCTVVGFVPDLAAEMAASTVSVSQCGYNTAMDILAAGMPSVVVPYSAGREDEQLRRARRLEAIGAVTVLEEVALSARSLVDAIRRARRAGPGAGIGLRLDGARRTAELVDSMVARGLDAMRAGAG